MAEVQIVVFLQNAWSPFYAGREWPRDSWLLALKKSRSGQRLRVMIDDFDVCENTTPLVGATPDSAIPPDTQHIQAILKRRKPEVVVACGKQAEKALSNLWRGSLLIVPHPAHRLLTDALYREARSIIAGSWPAQITLRQERGYVSRETRGLVA